MSFIDLMSNDVWTDVDIDNRVNLLIRSKVSENDELKAARLYRSGSSEPFAYYVDSWIEWCIGQGRQARLDKLLLEQVLDLERAYARLDQPTVVPETDSSGNIINQAEIDLDTQQRVSAQETISNSSTEAKELYLKRHPEVTYD